MSIITAIDPGPTTCGAVVYDTGARRVLAAESELTVENAIRWAQGHDPRPCWPWVVVIEQVMSTGQAGNDLLRTAEVCGRLFQAAVVGSAYEVHYLPRREVCRVLGISGKGKDAQVREVMIEIHGGDKAAAVGTKKAPGPLYGVSGHAWQALAVAVAWARQQEIDVAVKAVQAGGQP